MKAQISRNKINLPKLFLVNWVRAGTSNSLQYSIGLKSNTVKMYSVVQSVKLLLALSMLTALISVTHGILSREKKTTAKQI